MGTDLERPLLIRVGMYRLALPEPAIGCPNNEFAPIRSSTC